MQKRNCQSDRVVSVIFVGAGSASMSAANYLLDAGFTDFLILEKGTVLRERHCPGEKRNTCVFCKAGCPTIEGTGGSNANNGNKVCYFPASAAVMDIGGVDHNAVINYIDRLLPRFIDTDNIIESTAYQSEKRYESDVFNQSQFGEYVNFLADRLYSIGKLLNGVEIIEVEPIADRQVIVHDSHGNRYMCNNIVLATGRSSYKFIRKIFNELNIKYADQPQDIGIRVETNKSNFSENYYYQVDPKFKFDFGDIGSGRTFCAHNQGKLVPVRFGNAFYVDGAFGEKFTDQNNIALMVRTKEYLDNNLLEKWCKKVNIQSGQSYLLAEVDIKYSSLNEIAYNIIASLPSFPTDEHDWLFRGLITELLCGKHKILKTEDRSGTLKLYGPALDLYWPRVNLTETLSTEENSNLYVIGDAIGISRGFFQGIYSGTLWANKFIGMLNYSKNEYKNEVWSGRLSDSI